MDQSPDASPTQGDTSTLAELSREMVRIYKEQFGRGPTRVRSEYAGSDVVITTLEDTFTPAERNMAAAGEHQRLRDIRTYFQHAAEDEFVQTTERVTGRKVRAFISGVDTHKDVAAEMFVLEPER